MIEALIEGVKASDEEVITSLLEDLGAVAISLTDAGDFPILEPLPGETPLWPEMKIQALFQDETLAYLAEKTLQTHYKSITCNLSELPEQQWEQVWQVNAKPLCFGQRLWVCPSVTSPPVPEAVNIILDPGLAFGTGSHPTTALCLQWLDKHNLNEKEVVDYGCGSGILGIAALKLGASTVYAIDIDPQALSATLQNAIQNELDLSKLKIGEMPKKPVDVILANILLNPLIELKQTFLSLLKPGGMVVISGILKEQVASLQAAYEDVFEVCEVDHLEEWGLIFLQNK